MEKDLIRPTIYNIDLSKQLQRIFSGVLLAKNDKQANRMGVNVYQDGQAVSLSGYTVKGYFIRSGVETLILTGAIDGNTAYVDLDAKCYHKDGSFSLSVVLCRDGREQTLVIYDGKIAETNTDTIVENENTLSLADIVQQEWVTNVLNAADNAMEQAGKAAASAVEAQNILEEAAAEAQAIVDSIPPDYTEAVKKLDEKAPAIFVDASGDLVHITDGAEGMPVKSLITHIEPVQEGEGDPNPNNVRPISGWDKVVACVSGVNLLKFPYVKKNNTMLGISYVVNGDGTVKATGKSTGMSSFDFAHSFVFKAGLKYTLSIGTNQFIPIIAYVDDAGATQWTSSVVWNDAYRPISIYCQIMSTGKDVDCVIKPILSITAATDYEPYQGQTLTADLPETVYGGTLDWTTGVLTVDRYTKIFDGTESFTWQPITLTDAECFYSNLAENGMPSAKYTKVMCSHFVDKQAGLEGTTVNAVSINSSLKNILFNIDEATCGATVEEFKNYLSAQKAAGTPVVISYDLAEPYTIQLTPQQLSTLKGTNNVWSDAGATEVTYAADVKMYIDNLVTAIVNGQKEE